MKQKLILGTKLSLHDNVKDVNDLLDHGWFLSTVMDIDGYILFTLVNDTKLLDS